MTLRGDRLFRTGVALSLVGGLLTLSTPALAKAPTAKLSLHTTAASFRVGSTAQLTGTVSPGSATTVTVQRLVGKTWKLLGHAKPTARGIFSFSVKAPSKPATWKVRAVRPKTGVVKALTSSVIAVHVVKTAYGITVTAAATVTSGSPVVVTGTVTPKATGAVSLQAQTGATWRSIATAQLSRTSGFTLGSVQPLGSYQLRVVKTATSAVAQGISKTVGVTVALPPLLVTATTLPDGTVGLPYAAQLAASGGTPPYTWSASGVPTGLTLSPSGALSGTPRATLHTTVTVTVTDARLVAASAALPLRLDLSPAAANLVHDWGANASGQLGIGDASPRTAQQAVGITGAVALAGSFGTSFAVRFDGTVWAWGEDVAGELGDGGGLSGTGSPVPVQVPGIADATAIAAGFYSAYALSADGTVWAWGYNATGQLGDGTLTNRLSPQKVPGLTGVKAIAAGSGSALALKNDGTVWSWGDNSLGQLGLGTHVSSPVPQQVPGLSGVTKIVATSADASALLSDGTVRDWGYNPQGQLGDGQTTDSAVPVPVAGLSGVVQLGIGQANGYALKSDGSVWSWGYGGTGNLGNGGLGNALTPVTVPISGVVALAGGLQNGYALMADGTVQGWGYNNVNQLGGVAGSQSNTPVAIPRLSHVVAVFGGVFNGYALTAG
jgi:alpha-tubulin suppressor-like RCC1 family protein